MNNNLNTQEEYRYPLMEDFYTIQGEGANTGMAAYFLRLGGCEVGCVWCDVKESWDRNAHPLFNCSELVAKVSGSGARDVVITGGEPAMYNLLPLTTELQQREIRTYIETSGAYPLSGIWNWVCVSPKKFKRPLDESLRQANELKVIVYNKSDFDWAEEHARRVPGNCRLFLQPEFSVFDKVVPLIIDYVKNNPAWKISIQTHKIIGVR